MAAQNKRRIGLALFGLVMYCWFMANETRIAGWEIPGTTEYDAQEVIDMARSLEQGAMRVCPTPMCTREAMPNTSGFRYFRPLCAPCQKSMDEMMERSRIGMEQMRASFSQGAK